MEENKISTAKEVFNKIEATNSQIESIDFIIEFAKMHVKAKEEALIKETWYDKHGDVIMDNEIKSIYPLENIK